MRSSHSLRDPRYAPIEAEVVNLIPALRAFARSFATSQFEADDLVQDTLFRALRSLDRFEPGTNLKSWLFTIMHNAFRTQYRIRQRELPVSADYFSELTLPVAPTQDWCVLNTRLRTALESITPEHREILIMIAGFGLSYQEAAAICRCPVGTIKSRLSRAREELELEMHGNPLN
ncbi:RNA polymerase sigma factor [Ensifer adhaerens]|uniref:RNA polymerase sigma factor n=1 Tax=Ensifer adhaerens TaxID=106592 RepID=A0A0L8BV73_ENSAD|nr:sigma-70 family RNA polymerase sigma factor [Ensifer adhaerens]KOF18404.1 RNA polymerase sigma factor [Ensifer adhaerens]